MPPKNPVKHWVATTGLRGDRDEGTASRPAPTPQNQDQIGLAVDCNPHGHGQRYTRTPVGRSGQREIALTNPFKPGARGPDALPEPTLPPPSVTD
jgi:hypothetical protein